VAAGTLRITGHKQAYRGPPASKKIRTGAFIAGRQFNGTEPMIYALLPMEVLSAYDSGVGQGPHLQPGVPLTPGYGDRPP
jgi:hypothetical protein